MQDEQDGSQGSWDWERAFDDDFVRGAAAREDSGQARVERAARIAAQHRVSQTWRGEGTHLDMHDRVPLRGPRRRRRGRGLAAVTAVLVVLALLAAIVLGGSSVGDGETGDLGQATGESAPATASPTAAVPGHRLKALPPAVPGSGGYKLLAFDGVAGDAKWDPCKPIHYVIRNKDAPPGGNAAVRRAFSIVSAATGLVFVDDGATTEGPSDRRRAVQPRYGAGYAPVLVTWSSAREAKDLKGRVDGFAGAQPVDPDGEGLRLVTGEVTLDAPAFRGYSDGFVLEILLHELGHLAGLDHVDDDADIMYFESDGNRPLTRYTPGARRGLRLAGQGTCFA